MRHGTLFLWVLILLSPGLAEAGVPGTDVAVQVSARVQPTPPTIVLSWPVAPSKDITYQSHTVYRKGAADSDWGKPLARLAGTAGAYTDVTVHPGIAWEYMVVREAASAGAPAVNFLGYGYVYAGIELPPVESRGKIILLVDARQSEKLKVEITQLQQDLVGDGWQVLRHDIALTLKDCQVKEIIARDYTADPAHVCAVLLLGHIAVPYSGDVAPDGHDNHKGAWPADMYYGDMTGTWTDTAVDNSKTRLGSQRNRNVPGDGKWDQDHLPVDGLVVLAVGRVDMANLPASAAADANVDETALLRRYLDKDHRYRHNLPPYDTIRRRALLADGFNTGSGRPYILALAAGTDALFGPAAFDVGKWSQAAARESYLWSFGYAVGGYASVSGVTDTRQLAVGKANVVFAMLMGSYSGDWDSTDNVVRALLASQPTCVASGWGSWYLHHMAMGQTIGDAVRVTQNNRGLYPNPWATPFSANAMAMVHIALHGDPTLRLLPVSPPTNLSAAATGSTVKLTWTPSPQDVSGYYVFRSSALEGPFVRISPKPVKETVFADPLPPAGGSVYMVRALKLQTTGGGTFYDLSQGAFARP